MLFLYHFATDLANVHFCTLFDNSKLYWWQLVTEILGNMIMKNWKDIKDFVVFWQLQNEY